MKDLTIKSIIKVCQYDELSDEDKKLIDQSIEATKRSYAPYGAMRSAITSFMKAPHATSFSPAVTFS